VFVYDATCEGVAQPIQMKSFIQLRCQLIKVYMWQDQSHSVSSLVFDNQLILSQQMAFFGITLFMDKSALVYPHVL
jgi:hypothetical protein